MSTKPKSRFVAFVDGFTKGLGATAMLYAEPQQPKPARIEIKKLHQSILNPLEAMRSDWMQVGADIHVAIKRNRQAG